jgi:hypothetical protein
MVVPSGLADSLNHPSLMGILGASGLVPKEVQHDRPADGALAAASGGARPTRRDEA